MGYGDYYWGVCRDYCRGSSLPFPTKHQTVVDGLGLAGCLIINMA